MFSKRTLLTLIKFAFSAALIGMLIYQANQQAQGIGWRQGPLKWGCLLGAWAATLACLVLTIVRWFYLVRALDIPFRLRDAFRLGFLGYMFNFISLGSVGGDFFRAVFIAREAKEHRAEAVATVFIDRVIGLYILFVMAAIAIAATGLTSSNVPEIRAITWLSWGSTVVGGIGIVMLIVPGFTTGRVSHFVANLPKIGPVAHKLLVAVRIYRNKPGVLAWVSLLTVLVHSLSTIGVYLCALALANTVPPLLDHFVIVPLSMVAGALPLPMMGLGAVEATLDVLYRHVPAGATLSTTEVLKVAVAYRLIQILDALIGGVIYLFSRREVAELLHEAELEGGLAAEAESILEHAPEPVT